MKRIRLRIRVLIPISILLLLVLLFFFVPAFNGSVREMVGSFGSAEKLKTYILTLGIYPPVVILLLTLFQGIFMILPLSIVMAVSAMVFGLFWGVVISLVSQVIVGYLVYRLTKYIGRPIVEKYVKKQRLDRINRIIETHGRFGILVARLFPLGSYDVVNFAAGLLEIRDWDFIWGTLFGALPATIFFGLIGIRIVPGDSHTLIFIILSIMLLGFVILTWWILKRLKK